MFIGSHGFVCSLIRCSILRFLIARTSQHAVEPTHFEQTMLLECMQLDQACRSKEKQMIFVFKRSHCCTTPFTSSLRHYRRHHLACIYIYVCVFMYICIYIYILGYTCIRSPCLHLVSSHVDSPFLDYMFS